MTISKRHAQIGMTLVEVLIASTILFLVVTVVSESYRGSLSAELRAQRVVELLTPVPLIVSKIRSDLRKTPESLVEGQGILAGVTFRYKAVSRRFDPPPPKFDPDLSDFVAYEPRFRLYQVNLSLSRGASSRSFSYQELAWTPLTPKP